MLKTFDISNIAAYREDNRLEAKKAANAIPTSIWETYSAFANTNGGIILLGVSESDDGELFVSGVANPAKMLEDFWNTVNNRSKVSVNILSSHHAGIQKVSGKSVIVINVPRADRQDRPVYINDDLRQSFRRNNSGDYRCKMPVVKAMLRDAAVETQDMLVLEKMDMSVFDQTSIAGYRNRFRAARPGHVWEGLTDDEFLTKLGAVGRAEDGTLHPTGAGLVMFGYEYEIIKEYPQYFLDYQEHFDADTRWSDRLISTSGEWSGNVYDFFYKAYNKLIQNPSIKTPFKLDGIVRVDDTPVHKALREALANCLVNTDYYGDAGVVIKSKPDIITLENPGILRLPKDVAINGGISAPRNSVIMKMFNLLDIGERAGSGIPSIFRAWEDAGWETPVIDERIDDIERTKLSLPIKKVPIKSADKKVPTTSTDKNSDRAISGITNLQIQKAIEFMQGRDVIKSRELQDVLGVKGRRVGIILQVMIDNGIVTAQGSNKNRTYRLNNSQHEEGSDL